MKINTIQPIIIYNFISIDLGYNSVKVCYQDNTMNYKDLEYNNSIEYPYVYRVNHQNSYQVKDFIDLYGKKYSDGYV